MDVPALPTFNACMNTGAAVCLVLAFAAQRREDYTRHGILMTVALAFSAVFLGGYTYFHLFAGAEDRSYLGPGWLRYPYYAMLASHVLLAIINLPLVLLTYFRGRRHERERHTRLARWAYPIWMYVSVTGILVYLVLYVWAPGYGPDA